LQFLTRLNQYLILMGLPGLVAIAFFDSAAVPMPGGPDAVILLLSWQRPSLTCWIVLAAAIGSALGCAVLYGIGQKGGEKALSRFNPDTKAWVERKMSRNGAWFVLGAVMAPPPFPTKLAILAAGVFQTGRIRFALAVLAGRLVRYSIVGYLGANLGSRAAETLRARYSIIFSVILAGLLLFVLIRTFRRSRSL
jgi:membrane protein YqaA with SNARE-associated domain